MAITARTRSKASKAKFAALDQDMMARAEQLRAELTRLAESIGVAGGDKIEALGADAVKRYETLRASSEDMISDLSDHLSHYERQVSEQIREKPLQSLGVAVAVGFLASLLLRR